MREQFKGTFYITNQIKILILMNMHQDLLVSMVDPVHYFLKIEIGGHSKRDVSLSQKWTPVFTSLNKRAVDLSVPVGGSILLTKMACERLYLLPFRWWSRCFQSGCLSPVTGAWRKTRAPREQRTAWQESKNHSRLCFHTETNLWINEHSGQCGCLSLPTIFCLFSGGKRPSRSSRWGWRARWRGPARWTGTERCQRNTRRTS